MKISNVLKMLIVLIVSIGTAQAEFDKTALSCYTDEGEKAFTIGEYINRSGWGNELNRYQRVDFDVEYAKQLKDKNQFGNRSTGPAYLDHHTIRYENGHHTLAIGKGFRGEFLYVFKPEAGRMNLEIWKWSNKPHFGHVVVNGDQLVLDAGFDCY